MPASEPSSPRLLRLWYAVGAGLLLLAAIVSLIPLQADIGVGDKPSHLLVYFVLSGWFSLIAADRAILLYSLVGLVIFGILIEGLQGLTGYRYAEWGDVFANSLGCLLGSIGYLPPLRRLFAVIDARLAL